MTTKFITWNDATDAEKVLRVEKAIETLASMTLHEQRNHFDMSDWVYKNDCGTIACAAGQCAIQPWFRRRGFVFSIRDAGFTNMYPNTFFGDELYDQVFVSQKFTNLSGREAHKAVLKAIRLYLVKLKAEVALKAAQEAYEFAVT